MKNVKIWGFAMLCAAAVISSCASAAAPSQEPAPAVQSDDILVEKDGNRLIIRGLDIRFPENGAEFDRVPGLKPDIVEKNKRILNSVAVVLKRYPDYKITVEGHANNVTGTEAEEKRDNLEPLSQKRADVVRNYIVKQGVKNKITATGLGGKKPYIDRHDKENRWKNRRVEFILQK